MLHLHLPLNSITNEDVTTINPVTWKTWTIPIYKWEVMHRTTMN